MSNFASAKKENYSWPSILLVFANVQQFSYIHRKTQDHALMNLFFMHNCRFTPIDQFLKKAYIEII